MKSPNLRWFFPGRPVSFGKSSVGVVLSFPSSPGTRPDFFFSGRGQVRKGGETPAEQTSYLAGALCPLGPAGTWIWHLCQLGRCLLLILFSPLWALQKWPCLGPSFSGSLYLEEASFFWVISGDSFPQFLDITGKFSVLFLRNLNLPDKKPLLHPKPRQTSGDQANPIAKSLPWDYHWRSWFKISLGGRGQVSIVHISFIRLSHQSSASPNSENIFQNSPRGKEIITQYHEKPKEKNEVWSLR